MGMCNKQRVQQMLNFHNNIDLMNLRVINELVRKSYRLRVLCEDDQIFTLRNGTF